MNKDIFVWGCGGHSKVITQVILDQSEYEIKAYIDGAKSLVKEFGGKEVISEDYFFNNFSNENVVIAVGENYSRRKLFERAERQFQFPNLIHPSCVIANDVQMGAGNVIMPLAVVNPDTTLGDACVINTRSTLEHDCFLGSFATLAPGSTVCGGCRIGPGAYISAGATISHGIDLGSWCVVGGGAFVSGDVAELTICTGVPARFHKKKNESDNVLT